MPPPISPTSVSSGQGTAWLDISPMSLGSALMDILMSDEIKPGYEPSYQLCKLLYIYHPLGQKMAESPIKLAQSQTRDVVVPGAPEEVKKAFVEEWNDIRSDTIIAQAATLARIYGISSLVVGAEGVDTEEPLSPDQLADLELFFNVADPLNTSGSLITSQDPNSPFFQKTGDVRISGKTYHRSRACVVMHERPIFISFSSSAFGFTGRSVYQRALFPLKTFIQSMITNDMITQKAGLLVVKQQGPGSIIDKTMQAIQGIKRTLLRMGRTNNVLSVGIEESIETLNMQNIDGAAGFARTNVLKDIATAGDMPAVMLENETLTHGFGEGTEDAKIMARYIETVRTWLNPLYQFMTGIVQRRAWNKQFYEIIKRDYSEIYGDMTYERAFYEWQKAFHAEWPSLLIEPESELVKVEDVKLKALIATVQVLLPEIRDPDNRARVLEFFESNISESKLLFPNPLQLDLDAIRDYQEEQQALQEEMQEKEQESDRAPRPFSAAA